MSFIKNNLQKGEDVILEAKIHLGIFLPSFVCATVTYMLLMLETDPDNWFIGILTMVSILFTFLAFIGALLYKYTTELALTNKRVIAKFGFIQRSIIDISYSKLESVIIDQSVIQRLFGTGTILIHGLGHSKTPVLHVANALEFHKKVNETIN